MGAQQWFILPALAALARNVKSTARAITANDLSTWATDDKVDFPLGIADLALAALQRHGYLRPYAQRHYKRGAINLWSMTPEGLQAAQAALQAMPGGTAPDVQALSTRLWNLLRIRRRLTAVEAAQTLVDADDNFDAQTKRIGALLAAWAKHAPKTVVVAQKREAGRIRYVLLVDLGRWPPPSRAGQVHPSVFASVLGIPARYRKTEPRTVASQEEGRDAA